MPSWPPDVPTLAHSAMVAGVNTNVDSTSCGAPQKTTLFLPEAPHLTHPLHSRAAIATLSFFRSSLKDQGLSDSAANIIMQSWRDLTNKQYSRYVTKWELQKRLLIFWQNCSRLILDTVPSTQLGVPCLSACHSPVM